MATNMCDDNEAIKKCIKDGIEKSSLDDIKAIVCTKTNKDSLDIIEENYINRKYIKYCLKGCYNELQEGLKDMKDNDIQRLIENIIKIKNIHDLSFLFSKPKHFQLITGNIHLLSNSDCDRILNQFKQDILLCLKENVKQQDDLLKKVEKSLNKFLSFYEFHLSVTKKALSIDYITKQISGVLTDNGTNASGNNLLQNIFDLEKISKEKEEDIKKSFEEIQLSFTQFKGASEKPLTKVYVEQIKKIISYSLKPVESTEYHTSEGHNGRIIEGVYIILSMLLSKLEEFIKLNVTDIYCIALEAIFIDCDLKAAKWHGINLAMCAKRIIIIGKRKINLSGLNGGPNDKPPKADNGRKDENEFNKNGKHGDNGKNGESGGNLTIKAEIIEFEENLTIISSGGDGGYGQDGGDGCDGENGADGVGLTLEEFKANFKKTAICIGAGEAVEDMCKYIASISADSEEKIWNDGEMLDCHYVKGTTQHGNRIYFSFYDTAGFKTRQSYCFYRGTCGKPGKPGGFGGLGGYGGEPGYAGSIEILLNSRVKSKINIIAIDGRRGFTGKPGKDGRFGKPGENKPDVGYVDRSHWREPVYYGPTWLELIAHRSKGECRIRDAKYEQEPRYTKIECREKPKPPECVAIDEKAKQEYQQSKARKQGATRKRAVSVELLMERYNTYQCRLPMNSTHTLEIDMDLLQDHLSRSQAEETNVDKDNVCIIKPFIDKEHFKYKRQPNKVPTNQLQESDKMKNFETLYKKEDKEALTYISDMIKELKRNTYEHKQLIGIQCLIRELESIWKTSKANLAASHREEYQNLKFLVIKKLKLSVLHEIADFIDNNSMHITDEFIKEDTYPGSNSAIHAVSGTKNNVNIYEHRKCETIRKHLKKNITKLPIVSSEISTALHQSIMYLMEIDQNKEKFPKMKKYAEDFYKRSSNTKPDSNTNIGETAYCINQSTLSEYADFISQNGQPFNSFDIILLAYYYDICLNVYVLSDNDQNLYHLQHKYNANSRNVQHVLYFGDEFFKLSVRKIESKKKKCDHYNQILNKIQTLNEADKLEYYLNDFLKSKEYSDNNYKIIHLNTETCNDRENQNIIETESDEMEINEISDQFDESKRQSIRLALTPISPKFLSNRNVHLIKSLKNRFSIEKPVITHEIITLLSMSILNSYDNEEDLRIYQWIIDAYPQEEWINELALIKLERFTNEPYKKIPLWRSILRKIDNKEIIKLLLIKIEDINETFDITKLLSEIEECHLEADEYIEILTAMPLDQWSVKLQHFDFINSVHSVIHQSDFDSNQFSLIIDYLYSLRNKCESLINPLLNIFKEKKFDIKQILMISDKFYSGVWEFDEETIFKMKNTCADQLQNFDTDQKFSSIGERKLDKLISIINADKYTTIREKINKLGNFFQNAKPCRLIEKVNKDLEEENIKQWTKKFRSKSSEDKMKHLLEAICMVEKAITLCFPEIRSLRDAQKLTIASFILNSNNLLAQVATGEGKSLIVASIMIIKCLLGEKGDIITSSPVLAERDANENNKLYNLFGISVSHNSFESASDRRKAYENDVVYGDLSSFQRDYLLDCFYNKNMLGNRYENARTNIIVDEVDSMLLDKGNTVLYLSHQPASLDTLESAFAFIWQIIIKGIATGNSPSVDDVRKSVLHNLYPILNKQELKKLTDNQDTIEEIWNELIQNQNIDDDGKILSCKIKFEGDTLQPFAKHVEYLLNDIFNYEKQIEIPNYLKPFVERHSSAWIESAFKALDMDEGRNYVIDVDKSATRLDKHANIIIVDCETGVDQLNSQWNEGLHQFLQLKHRCKTSLLSLKAVFISNISFFNMYKNIYGVSGTLGSEYERDFLKTVYNVDFITVPVALSSKFKEDRPILCNNFTEWREEIVKRSIEICKKRSVLIICQTIKDVEQINQTFKSKTNFNSHNIFVYKRSYEKFSVDEHQGLGIGKVIIATNLAGRGTDIKINKELNDNGGLHVILSYLPENYRIEQQAFGRTARKGQKGSGQLIIIDDFNLENTNDSSLRIVDLKNERDINELYRVGKIRHYYETSIQLEEELFNRYHEAYNTLKEKLETEWKITGDTKDIILNSLLNKWTFWLDEIGTMMNNKIEIFKSLDIFLNELDDIQNLEDAINRLVIEPSQLIKLSKCLMKENDYEKASKLLQKVIDNEPEFSHAAHYYKAHCIIKQTQLSKDENKNEFNRSLDNAEYLFKHHINVLTARSAIMNEMSIIVEKTLNTSFVTIDSYQIQNENICNLYSCFIRSIHDIRGHSVIPETFVTIDINQQLASSIFNKLLNSSEEIFIKRKYNQNFNDNELKRICTDYALDFKGFKNYLAKINSVNEDKLKNYIDNQIYMPNREDFWRIMIKKGIIKDVENFIIIDTEEKTDRNDQLNAFINSKRKELRPLEELKPKDKSKIFFEKINFDTTRSFKYMNGSIDKDYLILEEQKFVVSNKIATVDIGKLRKMQIEGLQSVSTNNISKMTDLTPDESNEIYDLLVKEKIIDKETGRLLTNNFQNLNLGKYQVYDQRVITNIKYHCLYQSQILDMLDQIDSEDVDVISLTLPYNLHKGLLYDLETSLIITPVYCNYKKINVSLGERLCMQDELRKLEKLIKKTCDTEDKVTKSVARTLQSTVGKLNYLSTPTSHLNDMEHSYDVNEKFEQIEELDMFKINGLDHVIDVEEKRWTWKMWLSTAIVFSFGFMQIVAGVYLEIISAGLGTYIASGLIGEGLNDILYAILACRRGYFNWNDYFLHKIKSMAFTILTMGVTAVFSRIVRYVRYGSKLVTSTGYLSRMSGTQLLETAGNSGMKGLTNNVHKEVWCKVGVKLTEGIAFGATNAGISYISDKLLKGYSGMIINELFLNIKESIKNKKEQIKQPLKKIYEAFGLQLTQKWLGDLSHSNDSDAWYTKILEWVKQILHIVSDGIRNSLREMSHVSQPRSSANMLSVMTTVLKKCMKCGTYIHAMAQIGSATEKFIDDKIKKLEEKANECQVVNRTIADNELNSLVDKTTERWSEELEDKVDTDVRVKIIEPILFKSASFLLRKLGNNIQKYYQHQKDKALWEKFQSNRKQYEKQKENLIQHQDQIINKKDMLNIITNKYNHDLLVLMAKTKDPILVARIIEEGGPMDFVCVQALANLYKKTIRINNVDGKNYPDLIHPFGIKVEDINNKNCISIDFISGDGENTFGHFAPSGNVSENTIDINDNNCLIRAVMGVSDSDTNLVQVNNFRQSIAKEIKENSYINEIIKKGSHRYYISQYGFGGNLTGKQKYILSILEKESKTGNVKISDGNNLSEQPTHVLNDFTNIIHNLNNRIKNNTLTNRLSGTLMKPSTKKEDSVPSLPRLHALHGDLEGTFTIDVPYTSSTNIPPQSTNQKCTGAARYLFTWNDRKNRFTFLGIGDTHTGSYAKWEDISKRKDANDYIKLKTTGGLYGVRKIRIQEEGKKFWSQHKKH